MKHTDFTMVLGAVIDRVCNAPLPRIRGKYAGQVYVASMQGTVRLSRYERIKKQVLTEEPQKRQGI